MTAQSAAKLIATLECIVEAPGTITEVADRLGVHKSSALRYLRLLDEHGWARRDARGVYRGGSRIIELGQAALDAFDLRAIAHDTLAALNRATKQTVHLAVLEGSSVVYVDKHEAVNPIRMFSRIGRAAVLHCTGIGKAVLAWSDLVTVGRLRQSIDFTRYTENTLTTWESLAADLEASRARGYTIDDREHEEYIHCIAAPIRNGRDGTIGAISITAVSVLPLAELEAFAPDLLGAAAEISAALGWRGEPASAPQPIQAPRASGDGVHRASRGRRDGWQRAAAARSGRRRGPATDGGMR